MKSVVMSTPGAGEGVAHRVMPLYTPLSGSWLNLAEAVQRIIVRRARAGQHPQTPEEIITWLEDTVTAWSRDTACL